MKYLFILPAFMLSVATAQVSSHMYTSGNKLYDVCGNPVLIRGVNHAVFNWGWDTNYDVFDEISQSGSNAVRIPWYTSSAMGGGAPVYDNLAWLDTALTRCARNGMIPVLDLHDQTCQNNPAGVIGLTAFFSQPAVLDIIDKHQAYLIINFANEALYVLWGGSSTVYRDTYYTVIDSMRNYGIHVPIMIDAPDCGQHLDVFSTVGNDIKNHDPDTNILFSAHAYWYSYANNMDSISVRNKLSTMNGTGLPYVLGEVANLQSDGVNECAYSINYKPLLRICQEMGISWLAWSWDHDVCATRQVSTNGNYNSLTTYGTDIVNNLVYGLTHAVKSPYLLQHFSCGSGVGIEQEELQVARINKGEYTEWVNLAQEDLRYQVTDLLGRTYAEGTIPYGQSISIQRVPNQVFLVYIYGKTTAGAFKMY